MSQIKELKTALAGANMDDQSIEQKRQNYDMMGAQSIIPDNIKSEKLTLKGVDCQWFKPESTLDEETPQQKVLVYLHGGGYVIGSLQSHLHLFIELCQFTNVSVLGVDYRLAPEHPFPAAIDDALAVYNALLDQGYQSKNIAIAGDSAGGGLTMALLISLREQDIALPACAALLSPWVDLSGSGESIQNKAELDPIVSEEGLRSMAESYLGKEDDKNPLASPVFADLSKLPPILIHVGSDEILLDDSVRLNQRLREAGNKVEYKEWADMVHVFQHFSFMLDEGKIANKEIAAFIQSNLK